MIRVCTYIIICVRILNIYIYIYIIQQLWITLLSTSVRQRDAQEPRRGQGDGAYLWRLAED